MCNSIVWKYIYIIVAVQLLSHVWLFLTPWTAAHQAFLSIANSWSLLKLMSIELVMLSNHLILSCPLLLLHFIFPSIRVFSNEAALHTGDQSIGVSASASVFPMNIQDWFPLGLTGLSFLKSKKSLLQHHSSKASILQCSAFFTVQLSHPYMTTEKTLALTRWTFVGKAMSLLFNMLFRFLIAFLLRNKHLLISRLQSPSAMILEPKKIVSHCFHWVPIFLLWSVGTRFAHWLEHLTELREQGLGFIKAHDRRCRWGHTAPGLAGPRGDGRDPPMCSLVRQASWVICGPAVPTGIWGTFSGSGCVIVLAANLEHQHLPVVKDTQVWQLEFKSSPHHLPLWDSGKAIWTL